MLPSWPIKGTRKFHWRHHLANHEANMENSWTLILVWDQTFWAGRTLLYRIWGNKKRADKKVAAICFNSFSWKSASTVEPLNSWTTEPGKVRLGLNGKENHIRCQTSKSWNDKSFCHFKSQSTKNASILNLKKTAHTTSPKRWGFLHFKYLKCLVILGGFP